MNTIDELKLPVLIEYDIRYSSLHCRTTNKLVEQQIENKKKNRIKVVKEHNIIKLQQQL